jgi:integrase
MTHTRGLKYVHRFIDKRYGKAKPRFYFRRRGFKQASLPGSEGSAEFNQAYEAALAGHSAPALAIGAKRIRAGSIGALAIAYFNSPAFLALSASTRSTYRGILEAFTRDHGEKPLALLTRQHVNAMLAHKVRAPAAANHWLRLIKTLMRLAVTEGMRADDPTMGVNFIRRRSDGFHTWTEDEIDQFEARHPIGTKARLALGLLLYTAQRRSDVVRMGRQHVRNGLVQVRQQKTRKTLPIPVHPDLQAIIDAMPADHMTFLVTAYEQPFTPAGFGNWFRERCDEAGLPKHCAAHGLRKAACRRLAEAGCSANIIASISGHTTLREVERYTKAADQERMARAGMAAIISRTRSGNQT